MGTIAFQDDKRRTCKIVFDRILCRPSKSSGNVAANFMSIQDSTATGGANWYAGANSTDVSGNTGWIFGSPRTLISQARTLASGRTLATGRTLASGRGLAGT